MKTSSLILATSLAANIALIGVLAFRAPLAEGTKSATPAMTVSREGPSAVSATAGASANASSTTGKPGTKSSAAKVWDKLQSDDLATLVANLRDAGFPPRVIRSVLMAKVGEKYDARRLEIEKDSLNAPFWTQNRNNYMDPVIGPQLRALQREQMDTVRKLLGGNIASVFADSEEEKAMLRLQIGDIPLEKLDQLYALSMDYNEKRAKIYSALANGGTLLPADRQAIAALDKSMFEEAGKFLTPSEAADFNLRASPASSQLRYTLAAFQPTEDEFRTILPLYQAYREQFPEPSFNLPPEQEAARKAAQDQMINQVKGLLGADRGADFAQAIDPASSQLNRLVARLDLPISAATQVAAIQQDAQQRATAIRSDTSLTGSDRRTQMAALADEASTKVSAALGGARGLEAYKTYGGQWLMNLQPPPPRRAAPTK